VPAPGGLAAAIALAQRDAMVTVLESTRRVGVVSSAIEMTGSVRLWTAFFSCIPGARRNFHSVGTRLDMREVGPIGADSSAIRLTFGDRRGKA